MQSAVTVAELQDQTAKVIRRAEKDGSVAICREGRTVAFVVSRERMEAILETVEILSDPRLMKSLRDYESGEVRPIPFHPDEV